MSQAMGWILKHRINLTSTRCSLETRSVFMLDVGRDLLYTWKIKIMKDSGGKLAEKSFSMLISFNLSHKLKMFLLLLNDSANQKGPKEP